MLNLNYVEFGGLKMDESTNSIRLTVFGGIDEVGGNTLLLEDLNYDISIFLDFGIKIKKY